MSCRNVCVRVSAWCSGFTNNFVIQSSHPVAIAHNDQSPLENFHVAEAFRTAMEMGDNNPLDCLPPELYTQLRQLMIKLVLATVRGSLCCCCKWLCSLTR